MKKTKKRLENSQGKFSRGFFGKVMKNHYRWCLLACKTMRLWKRLATVMGHTPHGTGVIVAHNSASPSRSVSPHALPSLMPYPTSIIIFQVKSALQKNSGVRRSTIHVALTIYSLRIHASYKKASAVVLFVVMTVAPRRIASKTNGFHIRLLWPIIVTIFPLRSPSA